MIADKIIRCSCCNTPVAELKKGHLLIIKAKHHGEKHETHIEIPVKEDGG